MLSLCISVSNPIFLPLANCLSSSSSSSSVPCSFSPQLELDHLSSMTLMMRSRQVDHLSSLFLELLRSPPGLLSPPPAAPPRRQSQRKRLPPTPITAGGFASLLLGMSMALLFCACLSLFIAFLLIPWVVGLFILLYFVGFLSALSLLARSLLYYATKLSSSSPPPNHMDLDLDLPAWKLL